MIENVQFLPVDLRVHRSQIIDLNVEYLNWVAKEIDEYYKIDILDMMRMSAREYVTSTIEDLCSYVPSKGIYYLLKIQDAIIGMGLLKQIRESIGELKRMYIRPSYRGKGYSKVLLNQLLQKAKEFGYHSVYLDSGPFMTTAHNLYHSFGFIERDEYPETEVPQQLKSQWLFMEKSLVETTK